MASSDHPHSKEGFTAIPHKDMEHILKLKITCSELKLLLLICRETWGWQKSTTEEISLEKAAEKCSITRLQAQRSLTSLVDKCYVARQFLGPGKGYAYYLNHVFKDNIPLTENITPIMNDKGYLTDIPPTDKTTPIMDDNPPEAKSKVPNILNKYKDSLKKDISTNECQEYNSAPPIMDGKINGIISSKGAEAPLDTPRHGFTAMESILLVLEDGEDHSIENIAKLCGFKKYKVRIFLSEGKKKGLCFNPSRGIWRHSVS